jgi:GT2 family glycosyltransferase
MVDEPSQRVTVVVPTWRRAFWLDLCLQGLTRQHRPPSEVLVVGRLGEDDEARSVVQVHADYLPVRWVEVARPGHVAPVAEGLAEARGNIVAFLDDDAEPEPSWMGTLVEPFDDPLVACVGGRVDTASFRGKVHRDAGHIRWYGKLVGNVGALDVSGAVEVDGVMEGNWAWRRDVLAGLEFDPVLDFDDASMYGLDLCLQAKDHGYRVIYEPTARVVHHLAPRDPGLDRTDRPRRTLSYGRNYTYIALRRFRGLRLGVFPLWWWLVGDRGSYGLAKAGVDLVLRGGTVWPVIRASFAGKREGVRVWRKVKESANNRWFGRMTKRTRSNR